MELGHFKSVKTSVAQNSEGLMNPRINDKIKCKDDDNLNHIEVRRYASQGLRSLTANRSSNFYRSYYLNMKKRMKYNSSEDSAIEKLNTYMERSEKAEKYRILRTLTICLMESVCGVKVSVFNEFQSIVWGKELLLYTLLSKNDTWNVNQTPELVREVSSLDAYIKESNTRYCVEDVLEILIKAQNACQLDISFIIKVVKLLRFNVQSLDVISRDSYFLPSIIDELETLRLREICNQRRIVYTEEKQIVELHNLLLYSEETIDSTLAKVKQNTEITELIDFFEILKNYEFIGKEDFLRQLTPNKNIDSWKKELSVPLIQTFILREFPAYHQWSRRLGTFNSQEYSEVAYFSNSSQLVDMKSYTRYCEFDETGQKQLKKSLESSAKGLRLASMLRDLNLKLATLLLKCGRSEETLNTIEKWIKCLDDVNKVSELIRAIDILVEYDMDITESELSKLISQATLGNVQKEVHKFVINQAFPGTYEKTVDQLIAELIKSNSNEGISLLENKDLLRNKYNKVMAAYDGTSSVISSKNKIKDWMKSEVEEWVKPFTAVRASNVLKKAETLITSTSLVTECVQNPVTSVSQHEIIAVIKRTVELISGLHPRDIQLLSVILLLNSEESKGRLAQINTGEGKTTIIAMIAAYHAIRGNKVDIITSSRLLAIPQSEQQSKFYTTLGLKVGHNFHTSSAYLNDIVYGTSAEFQGDILRDEFRKYGTRHGRKCDIAIVDEVDNMLVDGKNHIVMLSCDMPAMDHLEAILAAIYTQVKTAAASIIEKDSKAYFVDQENAVDEKGQVKKDIVVNHVPIEGTKREFIEKSTEQHIRYLIRDSDTSSLDKDFPEIEIPNHLREFICKTQLKKWINRACAALFYYAKDEHYILVGEKVSIVDAANTGVVQDNMHWGDGLHQFIQIRHGARITPESLTTNFISNVSFFKRYRPKIYGLSGTLGTSDTKRLLKKTYEVDTVIVPPFKLNQHKELAAIVVNNRNDWYRSIVRSCLRKLDNGRAVLVIMEYIRETEILEKIFKEQFSYDKEKIKLYKTNEDSAVVDKVLKSGEIIITTNIAGRGTDINLSKDIDGNGGLHVCVTFLPKNSRVEQQNTGRTARTGNRGTSQFILVNSENDIKKLRNIRAEMEQKAMRNAEKEIARVSTKDIIFQRFCHVTDTIKGRNEFVRKIEKEAVEERFAIWMKMNDDRISEGLVDEVLKDFESFEADILSDDRDGNLIRNPYMHVKIGNQYLDKKRYKDAINEYSSAIFLDRNFAEHAYYNRGYAYVAQYGDDISGNWYYINKTVDDLKEARALIEKREHSLHLEQYASNGEVFSQKIRNKLNLYNLQKNVIDVAIGTDLVAINEQLLQLEENKKSDKLTSEKKTEIEEAIKNLKNLKKNKGVIETAKSHGRALEIKRFELKECLPDDDKSHEKEIQEFERNGAMGSFQISEIPPINWSAVVGLLALGFGQLIVGAAIMVFTLGGGASFGMGLIAEGISDIITAVRDGIINRSLSWATWAIEKAISLTISVVCAGFKAMKDVAKTVYAGTKTAATIGSKVVTQTMKEGWKIVAKKVGVELAKGVGKNIATEMINYGVNKTLIPLIQQAIIDKIQGPIEQALLNNAYVKTMLQLDEKNNNRHYECRIKAVGHEILNPATNGDLTKIAQKIATGIADKKVPGFATARQISTAMAGVVELTDFTKKFIDKLNNSIKKEANQDKIDESQSGKSESKDQQEGHASVSLSGSKQSDEDIDLNRVDDNYEQVKLQKQKRDPGSISKEFVRVVSTSMVNIIQGKMIAPLVQTGVDYTSDALTSKIDESMSTEMETYRAHKRVIHHQNKGFSENKKNKKCSTEEQFAMNKVNEVIEDARNGGPSGLVHLGAASDTVDRPIEVYDEKGRLLYIIGEDKPGKSVKVEYHEPTNGDTVGHYTLPGGIEPFNNAGGANLCLYNVIAEQTDMDSNHLKNLSLTIMEKNKGQMAKQASDITRLQMYAGMKLAMGGASYTGQYPDHAESYMNNSNGADAYGIDAKGHNNLHVPYKNTADRLEAVAAETNRKIEVYENGVLLYTIGKNGKSAPIKFEYHGGGGDSSSEYFTSIGGNEVYRLHNPLDKTFYEIIAKQTNQDATQLASDVAKKITAAKIPKTTRCFENAMKKSDNKTGYTSKAEMNFVMHYALQTDEAKKAMAKLNEYKEGSVDGADQRRQVVTLSKEQLGLPREAFATGKLNKNGKLVQCVWPVESITFLLQHHDGQQGDPNANVYVHTTYPTPPANQKMAFEGNEWGPYNKADSQTKESNK